MPIIFSNNASSLLAASIGTGDTTIQVSSGDGNALFPNPGVGESFYITLEDDSGNVEVCQCTARSGDLLTVVRGRDNTAAQAFTQLITRVEVRLTALVVEEFLQRSGGTLTGDLDFNGNGAIDAVLSGPLTQMTAGEIVGVPLRGVSGDNQNEIAVPPFPGAPTIGGAAILKTGDDIVAELDNGNPGTIILDSATTGVRLPANAFIRIEGSTNLIYGGWQHNDTDFQFVCANTTNLEILSLTGNLKLGAGIGLELTPSGTLNYDIIAPNIRDFSFEAQTITTSGSNETIDYQLGSYVTLNLNGIQLINLAVSNINQNYCAVRIKIVQDATGGRDITNWPTGTVWGGGSPPNLAGMAANAEMFVDLWTDDSGVTWYGGYSATSFS